MSQEGSVCSAGMSRKNTNQSKSTRRLLLGCKRIFSLSSHNQTQPVPERCLVHVLALPLTPFGQPLPSHA